MIVVTGVDSPQIYGRSDLANETPGQVDNDIDYVE